MLDSELRQFEAKTPARCLGTYLKPGKASGLPTGAQGVQRTVSTAAASAPKSEHSYVSGSGNINDPVSTQFGRLRYSLLPKPRSNTWFDERPKGSFEQRS